MQANNPDLVHRQIVAENEADKSHFHMKIALIAGLILGVAFLLVSRGVPWLGAAGSTHIMGRPFTMPTDFGGNFLVGSLLHLAVSACYGWIICSLVFRLNPMPAIFSGGVLGAILYGMNYLVFNNLLNAPSDREPAILISHVAFGLFVAAAYKGFSIPTPKKLHARMS